MGLRREIFGLQGGFGEKILADRLRDHGVRVPGLACLAMEDRKAQKGDGEKVDDKCMARALAPQFTYAQWVSRANQESRESAGKIR